MTEPVWHFRHRFDEDGNVEMTVTDEDGMYLHSQDIRRALFGWHAKSIFGRAIPLPKNTQQPFLTVPALFAWDWFMQPVHQKGLHLDWDEQSLRTVQAARRIATAIENGQWEPDFTNWRTRKPAFRLTNEQDQEIQHWFNRLMNAKLQQQTAVGQAWREVERMHFTLMKSPGAWEDAFHMQTDIGWVTQRKPLRPGFYLFEPEHDADVPAMRSWTLACCLFDPDEPDHHVHALPDDAFGQRMIQERLQRMLPIVKEKCADWSFEDTASGLPFVSLNDRMVLQLMEQEAKWFDTQRIPLFLPIWMQKARQNLQIRGRSTAGKSANPLTNHLYAFDWQVAIGDRTLSREQFQHLLTHDERLFFNGKEWIRLDVEQLQQLAADFNRLQDQEAYSLFEAIRMRHAGRVSEQEVIATELAIEWDPAHARAMLQWEGTASASVQEDVPTTLQAELRAYQRTGMSWLLQLRRLGLGGILADDMGLGKTIQWIAAMTHLRAQDGDHAQPVLIISPTSVLGNWQREIRRFAPHLSVWLHHGPQRLRDEAFAQHIQQHDVVITSYATAMYDESMLEPMVWEAIVLDEAHTIKNHLTKQAQAIRSFKSPFRLALTGTPVENHAGDLWSIMQFVNPGYLGSLEGFRKLPVDVLKRLIQPFVLRRMKNDAAIQLDLPDKIERSIPTTLTTEQAVLYEGLVKSLLNRLENAPPMQRRGLILSSLMRLKQLCNHPALMLHEKDDRDWRGRSHKWDMILELIEAITERGEKALIFTQFLEMGRHLEAAMNQMPGARAGFYHGSLTQPEREQLIQRFQHHDPTPARAGVADDELNVLILSIRAGGSGLNLTAAAHVIHADRWWNPAVEEQATDRAHRIGQTQVVEVHKFLAVGTIEERIDTMLREKKQLRESLLGTGEQWITELSNEELHDMLSLRKEWIE